MRHLTQNQPPPALTGQEYGPAAADRYRREWRIAMYWRGTYRAQIVRHKALCEPCSDWNPVTAQWPACHHGTRLLERLQATLARVRRLEQLGAEALTDRPTLF